MFSTIVKALDNNPSITPAEKKEYLSQIVVILKQELAKFEEGCVKSDQGKAVKDYYASKVEMLEERLSHNIEQNQEKAIEQETANVNETRESNDTAAVEDKVEIVSLDSSRVAVSNHVASKVKKYSSIEEQIPLSSILEEAKDIIPLLDKAREVQSQNHSESKVDGVQHVRNVLLLANYIGKKNGVSKNDLDLIREAAIYHDIEHKFAGRPGRDHAENGATWYLENANSTLNKKEVAFLIAAHEAKGYREIEAIISKNLPDISKQRKIELIKCAKILQDADRLDILRYDIEDANGQRFKPNRLNDYKNTSMISAVIELNTRQALKTGYLQASNDRISVNRKTKDRRTFNETTLDDELMQVASETNKTGYDGVVENMKKVQELSNPDLKAENPNKNPAHPDDEDGPNQ